MSPTAVKRPTLERKHPNSIMYFEGPDIPSKYNREIGILTELV